MASYTRYNALRPSSPLSGASLKRTNSVSFAAEISAPDSIMSRITRAWRFEAPSSERERDVIYLE